MPGFFYVVIGSALGLTMLATGLALLLARRLRVVEAGASAALRQAEIRGRCLGMVAHELQTSGFALLSLPGPAAAAAQRMLALADDVSDSLASGGAPRCLSQGAVPLTPLLEEVVAAVAAQLGPCRRQWRLSPAFEPLALEADRRALRGALLQVLGRAARMTKRDEWIDVRPVLTHDSLAIVVEDEGAGSSAGDLSGTVPDGTRGIGFGLAMARSLLEAHGGALRLEAVPGVGTRTWLTLPRKRLVG